MTNPRSRESVPGDPTSEPVPPPSRPRFRPALRWARWALIFLLAFTFLRGAVWGVTVPSFYGPDEDYHFLYAEYLTTQHALPDPEKPLYPLEYPALVTTMDYNAYGDGKRPLFEGHPKFSVRELEKLPDSYREPAEVGRGIGVVHPPLYHLPAAAVNASLGDASVLTRYHAVRWLTSVMGILVVYAAWLLAAQVFRQEALRLLAAFVVATQPMIAFLSGIANHDALVIGTFTLASAFLLFLLRTPPAPRQGLWLGGVIVLGLLTKSSALALVPLAGLAYGVQALIYRDGWRTVLRSAGLAALVVLLGAGWWYARSMIVYDTLTGALPGANRPAGEGSPATLDNLWQWTRTWTGYTYRTYWFHHFFYEAPKGSNIFYLPSYVGAGGMLGLGVLAFRTRRELLRPDRPLLRQAAFLVISAVVLYVSVLTTDIKHVLNAHPFSLTGGRYLLPAYAGVAVLLIAGLRELVRERAQPVVFAGLAVLSGWFCWSVYDKLYVQRYYADSDASWSELFRNMSFDRPEFVTVTTLKLAMALIVASLVAAATAVVLGNLPPTTRARVSLRRLPVRRRAPAQSR